MAAIPHFPVSQRCSKTPNKERHFQVRTDVIAAINPQTGLADLWDNVKQRYPGAGISTYADVTGSWDNASLTLAWTTDIGINGTCVLPRSKADQPPTLVPTEKGWDEYKTYVASLEGLRHLFRGQNKPWRLRTAFHRCGRADLVNEDIPALHKRLRAPAPGTSSIC